MVQVSARAAFSDAHAADPSLAADPTNRPQLPTDCMYNSSVFRDIMALAPGTRLGAFQLVALIGAGGAPAAAASERLRTATRQPRWGGNRESSRSERGPRHAVCARWGADRGWGPASDK